MDNKKTLLLVDDDDAVFEFLSVKLGRELAIVYCASAAEALERLAQTRPDLILCDVDLPGLDGGDLSATLFADGNARDIPFLFLTALLGPAELAARDHQLAGRAAISKQSPVDEILRRIRAALY